MKKLLLTLALSAVFCGAAEFRIEGNAMDQDEGWAKHCAGTQGAMLYATKKDIKLRGTYPIPEAGKYFVWVYTQTNNEGWRRIQVKINGVSFGKFGDNKIAGFEKPCMIWKRALMPLEIANANDLAKVEITAISGSARFDCIVLSTNPDFDPSKMAVADIVDNCEEIESAE